jgi:hypothetical protein
MASLGATLTQRHSLSAEPSDLRESFDLLSSAANRCPMEPCYLTDFGELLIRQYQATGSVDYLNEAFVFLRRAYELHIRHPVHGRVCQLLAAATILKDAYFGHRVNLSHKALIDLYKESLQWRPLGHHSHFEGWDGLGMAFQIQFRLSGNIDILNCAIHCGQTAYAMLNPQHPRAFRFSANLSHPLQSRYEVLGNPADLQLAIFHARRAVKLGPADRRPLLLLTVATLLSKFDGDNDMLSEAILLERQALETVHQSSRFKVLLALGNSLVKKASLRGDIDALNEGIHLLLQGLKGVDERTASYTEGVLHASQSLLQRYEMDPSRPSQCLTEAIQLLEGLSQRKFPELYREDVLQWTAKAYRARFYHERVQNDLEAALAADEHVLNLRP